MDLKLQQQKARTLLDLHQGPHILVLPNAWDAASARIFEDAGFAAIATTSAGIAYTLGHPDGEEISRDEMLEAVRHIAESVTVPVTADVESGYGAIPEDAARTAQGVIAAGAVGLNLEDGHGSGVVETAQHVEKVKAVREAARSQEVHLVINARTDIFLHQVGDPAGRLGEAVRRANAYRAAGADSLFVPGVNDPGLIATLAREIEGPLNILAVAGTPNAKELERLGVRRVSVGSGPMRAALTLVQKIAVELRERGTYQSFTDGAITHAGTQRLFARHPPA